MVLRHALFQRDIAENFVLLVLVSSHTCFLTYPSQNSKSFSATSEGGLQYTRVSLSASNRSTICLLPLMTAAGTPKPLAREPITTRCGDRTPDHDSDPPPPLPYGAPAS